MRRWRELGELPAAYWVGEAASRSLRAVQYLHLCTLPEDRVIVLSAGPATHSRPGFEKAEHGS